MNQLYDWIRQLCINSGKDAAFLDLFWERLQKSPGLLAEMDVYRTTGELTGETKTAGYTVIDVMVWQIDHFKSRMDLADSGTASNPDCMVLMAFDTMLRMEEAPGTYIRAMQSETGTDYEGKFG